MSVHPAMVVGAKGPSRRFLRRLSLERLLEQGGHHIRLSQGRRTAQHETRVLKRQVRAYERVDHCSGIGPVKALWLKDRSRNDASEPTWANRGPERLLRLASRCCGHSKDQQARSCKVQRMALQQHSSRGWTGDRPGRTVSRVKRATKGEKLVPYRPLFRRWSALKVGPATSASA